jgi:hypothetical protein
MPSDLERLTVMAGRCCDEISQMRRIVDRIEEQSLPYLELRHLSMANQMACFQHAFDMMCDARYSLFPLAHRTELLEVIASKKNGRFVTVGTKTFSTAHEAI